MTPSILPKELSPEGLSSSYRSSKDPYTKSHPSSLDGSELVLEEQWMNIEAAMARLGVGYSTMLKAAWVIALRCFQPSDVTCFSYRDDGLELSHSSPDKQLVYAFRFDSEEKLQGFLERIDRLEPSKVAYGVACNSSIRFIDQKVQHMGSQKSRRKDAVVPLGLTVTKTANSQVKACLRSNTPNDNNTGSILRTFQHVLSQITITKAPRELTLADLDLCSAWDRRVIRTLTSTPSQPEPECLHDLILKQCRLHPNRKAVCSFDGVLTYGELEDLSLRLAHHLVHLGVRPETFVMSAFQKSTWAIVARLAILRAGGAYISIHASNPPAYLDSVIQRTDSRIMLADAAFAHVFRDRIESLVEFTPEWLRALPAVDSKTSPCEAVQASNACTVLFTSGSTGLPKGIIQEHRAYAAAIRDYSRNLDLHATTRFLHFDDYAFDISNLEFLVPLILGGCCCVPGPMKTIQDLTKSIQSLNATMAFLTPTVAIKMDPADVPGLKTLCVGGEPLPKDLLDNWASSSTRLINQFGMGEAAVCCAYNDQIHAPGNNSNVGSSTIGRPSSGAIWLIDPHSPEKLVPIGAIGEIVIEGPHLSRGYLDQNHQAPDRTKPAGFLLETPRWMAELHPERRSTRLYRSGDLARWNHNGGLEYVGRRDTIVKLDGCRIDVTEVEHLARKCLSPKDAVVVDLLGVIDGKEDPRLAAFLYLDGHPDYCSTTEEQPRFSDAVADRTASEKVAQIKASIAESLPSYMIPTVFLLLSRMPRTASNKTDRRKIRLLGQNYYLENRGQRASSQSTGAQLPP